MSLDRPWFWALVGAAGLGGGWASTRAWGSWSGAVRRFSAPPAVGVAVVRASQLPPDWADYLGAFDFISPKVMDGRSPYRSNEIDQILGPTRAAGCGVQGWGFHYLRDADAAAAEGTAAAERSIALRLGAYWCNAEKHWLGIWKEPDRPDPAGAMSAFVAAFRAAAPDVPLIFNGISGAHLPAHVKGREVEIASWFDAWGPMIYGNTRDGLAKKWAHGAEVARAAGVRFTPMPATGRWDPKISKYWGFVNSSGGSPGLLDNAAAWPPDWVAFFAGDTSGARMMTTGNEENPALAEVSAALKRPGVLA